MVANKVKSLAGIALPPESDPRTLPIVRLQQALAVLLAREKPQQNRLPSGMGFVSAIEKKLAFKLGPGFTTVRMSLPVEGSAVHRALVPLPWSADMQLPSHLRSSWTPATSPPLPDMEIQRFPAATGASVPAPHTSTVAIAAPVSPRRSGRVDRFDVVIHLLLDDQVTMARDHSMRTQDRDRARATAKSFTEGFVSDDACLPLDTRPKRGAVTRGERF
jgi:hypothetical protein